MPPSRKKPLRRIVASAMLDPRGVAGVIPVRGEGARPWDLYQQVPELQSAIEWLANAISRADLYVARRTPDGLEKVDDPKTNQVLDELFGTGSSQSDMLKRIVTHLEGAGETYLVPYQDPDEGTVWVAASTLEIRSMANQLEVQVDTAQWIPASGKVLRIWYPDPVQGWRADSPVVAMEPVLRTIIALTARTTAIGESRLAGNGILALSDTLSVEMPASEGTANPVRSRDIVGALEDAMVAPMTDRGLVSSVMPILIVGPKEDLPTQDSWITMSSPLDEKAAEQLEQYLRRMATSMGLPPEIVLGLGESNHWNAYVIVDQAVTVSVEPRTDVITSALTTGYARPRWRQLGIDGTDLVIAADLTDLTVKPDRSEAAERARAQGLMTDEAWALHVGFDESVIPTGEERKRIILEQLLRADPATAPWILPELGITVPGFTTTEPAEQPAPTEPPSASGDAEIAAGDVPGADGPPEDTDRTVEEPRLTVAASLNSVEDTVLTAIESTVLAVLTRAGNRLQKNIPRSERAGLKDVPPIDLHTHVQVGVELREKILRGAYDSWSDTMPRLVPLVSTYVDYLIDNQLPHSREFLAETIINELSEHMPPEVIRCA